MSKFTLTSRVEAPPETVFALFSDFRNIAGRVEGITKVEVLTDGPIGVGTRFRETRLMFNREATEEMLVTAFEPGRSYEIGCQSCGANFRTVFRFEPEGTGTGTVVTVDFSAKAVTWLAWFMKPLSALMMPMMKKCIMKDVECMKKIAEGGAMGANAAATSTPAAVSPQ